MRNSAVAKRLCSAVLLVLGVVASGAAAPASAGAATPAHTDVMFVFDTTGSMGGAITEAKEQIQEAMTQIGASLPDVQFGLAEMRDYSSVNFNGTPEEIEEEELYDIGSGFQPWTLVVPITANQSAVAGGITGLFATGGGDGPEAYGRALFETDGNPAVGWRPGTRGVIVLVADNVPHDTELNDGIPSNFWVQSPFNTGADPGPDNTVATGDDLDWQNVVLPKLINDGRPLEFVDYFGFPPYFPYWQNWTARTGGSALQANGENLAGQIAELVRAGASATLPPCPPGQVRDVNEHCGPPPSNNFKIEPRISCSKGCHVVLVKIVFDSAGNVIGESVLDEESHARAAAVDARQGAKSKCAKGKKGKCKPKPLIKPLSQAVVAGPNTLKLKLTGAALKALHKKGKLKLKIRFTFTPTGGFAKSSTHTFTVKLPKSGKHRHSK